MAIIGGCFWFGGCSAVAQRAWRRNEFVLGTASLGYRDSSVLQFGILVGKDILDLYVQFIDRR